MVRRFGVVVLASVLIAACGGSGGSSDERVVLVDYSGDDVTTFVAQNFPKKVAVVPGQTVVFEQQWTGEPHTLTTGTKINESLKKASAWLALFNGYESLYAKNPAMVNPGEPTDVTFAEFARLLKAATPAAERNAVLSAWRSLMKDHAELPDIDNPPAVPFSEVNDLIDQLSEAAFEGFVFASNDNGDITQNIGQPCFLKTGQPPEDEDKPCTATQQKQPVFDGTESFYNSGILPYEGPRGNSYRVKLADDIKPGSYYFYCAIHGPGQVSEIDVQKPGTKVASARDVAREGRAEARDVVLPLERAYQSATRTNTVKVEGKTVKGPFAGLPAEVHGAINEFVPQTIKAKAGEAITWKILGADHTISFDVPPYLPIIEFGAKRVRMNPKVRSAAGGSPEPGDGPDEGIHKVDGGTYDGKGFWSSGLFGGEPYAEYTLRISKPGTYPYACLVHPRMIGKVIID